MLARLRLCDRAACLDWDKLQLTREETEGISTVRSGDRPLDPDTLTQLHDRTQGWAAGVVLMLEQSRGRRQRSTRTRRPPIRNCCSTTSPARS